MKSSQRTMAWLVNQALYLSISDRQFQMPQLAGDLFIAAWELLESMLVEYQALLPFKEQVRYEASALVVAPSGFGSVMTCDFCSVDQVIWGVDQVKCLVLRQVSDSQFNALALVAQSAAIPTIFYFDRMSLRLYVYPSPRETKGYLLVLGCKRLDRLTKDTPIPKALPSVMQSFLCYELASRLCDQYGVVFSAQKLAKKRALYDQVLRDKTVDLPAMGHLELSGRSRGRLPFPWFYVMSGGR